MHASNERGRNPDRTFKNKTRETPIKDAATPATHWLFAYVANGFSLTSENDLKYTPREK